MSDSAFKTAAYPGYSTEELRQSIANGAANSEKMAAEIARRELVTAGDVTVMTPGERLRFARRAKAGDF